jgi:hypothetical protein
VRVGGSLVATLRGVAILAMRMPVPALLPWPCPACPSCHVATVPPGLGAGSSTKALRPTTWTADTLTSRPQEYAEFAQLTSGELPAGWESALPTYTPEDKPLATRQYSQIMLNALAPVLPGLMGGSADLAPSNLTLMKMFGDFQKGTYNERNVRFGVREHGMGAIVNGMGLHGSGIIPYCATFFIFTDYMRGAMRMSALSEVRRGAAAGSQRLRGPGSRQALSGQRPRVGAASQRVSQLRCAARSWPCSLSLHASIPATRMGCARRKVPITPLTVPLVTRPHPSSTPQTTPSPPPPTAAGCHLRDDPRLHRPGRGRPHPPAHRAPGVLPRHAQHADDPPLGRQ